MTLLLALALLALIGLLGVAIAADVRGRAARPGARGADAFEDSIDLHTFPPREIEAAVLAYLEEAVAQGLREVRLIHGKGKGVQRGHVQGLLREHPLVESFFDAPPGRGAWGATIARLAARDDPETSP